MKLTSGDMELTYDYSVVRQYAAHLRRLLDLSFLVELRKGKEQRGRKEGRAKEQVIGSLGTIRGFHYLHEKCRDCIIHCDIKPENILLDAEFGPKVADFGLAKLVGRDFSRVLTTMRGTRGYLAPEWISGVAIMAKADDFSYGMMLFEIVSGRRNSEPSADGRRRLLEPF